MDLNELAGRVARAHTRKRTPTQMALDDLNLEVSDDRFNKAMALFARHLGGRYDQRSGVVHLPWENNSDRTFPNKLVMLYRKFPCGMIHKEWTNDSGKPCVSFDIIPQIPNPSKSKIYKSFQGEAKNAKRLFNEYLMWLKKVSTALKIYVGQRNPDPRRTTQMMLARRVANRYLG